MPRNHRRMMKPHRNPMMPKLCRVTLSEVPTTEEPPGTISTTPFGNQSLQEPCEAPSNTIREPSFVEPPRATSSPPPITDPNNSTSFNALLLNAPNQTKVTGTFIPFTWMTPGANGTLAFCFFLRQNALKNHRPRIHPPFLIQYPIHPCPHPSHGTTTSSSATLANIRDQVSASSCLKSYYW